MTILEFHEFLTLYAWELLTAAVSMTLVCSVFGIWIDYRTEQITKNWKGALDANT